MSKMFEKRDVFAYESSPQANAGGCVDQTPSFVPSSTESHNTALQHCVVLV